MPITKQMKERMEKTHNPAAPEFDAISALKYICATGQWKFKSEFGIVKTVEITSTTELLRSLRFLAEMQQPKPTATQSEQEGIDLKLSKQAIKQIINIEKTKDK